MAASLSQLCKDCEASFVDLKRSLDEYLQDHEESRPCVLDQYERFQIWAGNIGAKQESTIKTSLDWRVREAPKIQYQIGELLGDLCSAIEELDSIISGKRPNRTASPLSTNEEACTEEHGLSEIDELVRMLSESITDLFKISLLIQRATPRDRFLKAQSSNKQPLDPYHDISHVSHKFPMLAEDDKQWLSYKLGLANTQRRQFFRYVRQHREMKAVVPENPVSAVPEIDTNGLTDPNAIGVDLPETRTVVSSQRPASSFAQTTASTLAMAKLQPVHQEIDDEDLMSHMSFATSVNESSNSERLRVPNLEDIAHGQLDFECPYCYKIVRPRSHNQWKKHVFEDLRPYICTFKGCDTKLFNDRRVWFEHEMQNHRVTYQCRLCSHRPYTSEDQLQQHLLARHQELCQPNTLVAMLKASQNSQESFPASSCPCCHDWETKLRPSNRHIRTEDPIMVTGKQFRNHLASHQEQLALFALPKQYNEDGEDFKSAGVVAGGSAANLSDASDLSIASSSHRIEDKTGKLFKKLVELLNAQESSDNYTLNSVVKSLLVDTQNADEIFRIVLLSSHPLREELIKITIKHGANTNQSFEGRSSLCIACATQNLDLLCTLLEAGSAISSRHGLAPSALHLAATIGWIDGCLELVRYGADLNSASDMDDNRPIHAAVQIPNESILELLLASGADINVTNRAGRTALHIAVKHRNTSSIRLLLQHGIDVNRKDQNLRTALHDAAATGQRATVNLLLSVAARTNTIDLWDNCPLTSASMVSMEYSSNCKAIVESLLNNGASIQLWSTGIPVTTLRVRLDGLTKLQQILEELGSPIAIDAQNHIVEANCTAFGAIQPSRGHIVSGSDHTEASTTDPERTISNPESSHWRDAELRQLDILHQRREQFGIDKEFLDGLEMLGKLYQEWIDACYPENKTPSNPETRVIISQILDRMHRLTIDLWMNNRQEAAEDLMVEIIRNYSSAIKESSTISKYNVITAIAAAIRTFSPQEHLWKRALRDSDWREAIRIRDTTTKQPASALPSGCARCAGIVFWNDTIYNLHLTWHDNEQRNVDVLEPSPSHHRWVSRSKSEPKRSLYTGLMVYGIMNLDWQSAGDDELSAKKGESIAILARSNHEWLIAKSFDQPGEPGLLPLSALRIFSMETDWHPLDPSAIEAASIPNVSEWKKLDRLLKSRSAIRSSEAQGTVPSHVMVTFSRISNNLDLYDLDCQMSPGSRCMLTRFYVEFLELHIILLQQFPVNSKGDDKVLPYLPGLALSNGRSEALDSYLNQLLALPPNISQSTSIRQFFTPGVEHPLQSPGGTHRFSFDGMQEEELDKLRTTISTAEQSPETNTLSRSEHLPDQGSTIDICEPLDAQMNTKSASVKNNDHQLQRNFRDSLCETLVAGFPRFNINLAPKIAKTLAIWLIHVYALNIGKRTEAAINIILEQLNTVSSNDSELTDWLSQSIHKHLELQLPDASLSRLCNNCGKSETLYWTDHNHPSRQRVRKNARICITCVVSIYLLDVTNNVNHGKFSSWIILEILRLGSKTIKAYYHQPEYKITDEELGGAHQRMIILYGLNLLHITNPLWPSSKGEARVSSWIWSIIQKNPDSYIMTTQEKVLFEQYEPRFILEHDVGIIKAAYSRYEEAESSRILALTSVPQSPAQLKVPIISAISFLFTIIDVKPDYDAPDHQIWEKGWLPPDTREAIKPSVTERPLGNIYRWTDGIVRKCDDLDNNKHRLSTSLDDRLTFSTYTVMMDKSNAFACVPFDARRVEVRTSDVREWQYLGFDHITSSAGPTGRGILSKVVGPGHFPRLAGYKEDRSSWIRDFFPGNYQSVKPRSDDKTPVTHLGLVGNLALVIALAAFTAPAHKFDETIYNNFYSGRRWASTREIFHARMRQRGVVVAIWEDVTNPTRSTRDTLQSLEAGELGPILHGDTEAGRTDEVPTYEASREFPHLADRHRESRDERTSIIGNDSSDRFSRSRRSIIDRERKQAIDKSGYIRQPDLISSLAQAQYETTPRTPLSASYPDLSNPPRAKMADREAFGQPDNQKTSGTAGTSGASASASASVSVAVDDNDDSDKGKVIVKASRKKKELLSGVARLLSFRKGERRRGSMSDDSDK